MGEAWGAFEEKPFSAKAAGLGEAMGAFAEGADSLAYNPAGLRFSRNREIVSGYTRLFSLEELSSLMGAVVWPTEKSGVWGASYTQFGPTSFREREFSLGHGFFLTPHVAAGYTLKGSLLRVDRYGSAVGLGLDVGFLTRFDSRWSGGLVFRNANQPSLGKSPEGPSSSVRAGVVFRPWIGGSAVGVDAVKNAQGKTSYRWGSEFSLTPSFLFRFGLGTHPNRYSVGLGFCLGKMTLGPMALDYAFLTHPFLPDQHQTTLRWKF
jgi:hypothetical protein